MRISADLPASGAPTLRELLQTQTFDELKARATESVRQRPANSRDRWLLFQLLCVDGEWQRALMQLQTWATLEPDGKPRAQLHRELIQSELFRTEVFAGLRTPGFIDPPPAWLDTLLRANERLAKGDVAGADALRDAALNGAPATRGDGGQTGAFDWLTDSDSRLGPVCEMAVAGGYRWVPFDTMQSLVMTPVSTLTDVVWRAATAILRSGAVLRGYVPVRYPGSESGPADIKLARETTWTNVGSTGVLATGQKTWATDRGDFGLLEIGTCRFLHDGDPQ
ncbi:type VI secretion system accessory protein TagJ [Paraburkholderia caballeronis]|uniref:type VI secretion system accessory protein TagJ n=1 Tax=Paraburkholderia caballeronis TaxID=416943 RepID=UPI0010670F0F|nr:type VI secretion system accessory protein TagJ [Paraburkholderia caballeronis]TDV16439.1 type VI secretion system protein ImpE [Paraburkholderia caballeronis]TDV18835.1 type VI secretion system protein ImpE [Paraburkholderia caballeronis]TDV26968.1 type VI secretion system protein ImpE [Paraburkholderia caballeronis]